MPHTFDAFGTPCATFDGGPRDVSRDRESTESSRIGLFHMTRMHPSPSTPPKETAVSPHHITRTQVRPESALFVGGSMELSPSRPPSPPTLPRRNSTGSPVTPAAGTPRPSFQGGSMAFVKSNEAVAGEKRQAAEVDAWHDQQSRAKDMPAAGASCAFLSLQRSHVGSARVSTHCGHYGVKATR